MLPPSTNPLEVGEMMVESRTGQKDDIRRKYIAERKLGWGVYSTVGRLRCPRPCGVVLRDNLFQVWLAKEVVKKSSKTAAPRLAIKIQKSAKEYNLNTETNEYKSKIKGTTKLFRSNA